MAFPRRVWWLFAVNAILCGNAWCEEDRGNGENCADKNVCPQNPVPAKYYIAQFQAKVVPNRMFTFVMPEAGELDVFVQAPERVPAGTLLAFVNRKKFEDERADLELRIEQEKLTANKEILALVFRKEELEFFSKFSDEDRAIFQKEGDDKTRVDQRARDLLDEEIRLAKIKAKKSEERARKEFETRRQSVEMRAPFAGKVELHFTRGNDENEKIPLYPGVPVVTIADDSDYFIAFPMANVAWARLPKNRLVASLAIGAGTQISGKFSHARIEKRGNVETLVYFFKVPETQREDAANLLGVNAIAELFYESPAPLTVLDKADLICGHETEKFASWEALVSARFPRKHLVFNGETTLVLEDLEETAEIPPSPVSARAKLK